MLNPNSQTRFLVSPWKDEPAAGPRSRFLSTEENGSRSSRAPTGDGLAGPPVSLSNLREWSRDYHICLQALETEGAAVICSGEDRRVELEKWVRKRAADLSWAACKKEEQGG